MRTLTGLDLRILLTIQRFITIRSATATQVAGAEASTADRADPKVSSAEEISTLTASVKTILSLEDIIKILPHRYPFLLVDKVVEYEEGNTSGPIKWFQEHYLLFYQGVSEESAQ